jgi:hypothetical protein
MSGGMSPADRLTDAESEDDTDDTDDGLYQ